MITVLVRAVVHILLRVRVSQLDFSNVLISNLRVGDPHRLGRMWLQRYDHTNATYLDGADLEPGLSSLLKLGLQLQPNQGQEQVYMEHFSQGSKIRGFSESLHWPGRKI